MKKDKSTLSIVVAFAVCAIFAYVCETPTCEGEVGYNVLQCDFGITAILGIISAAIAAASGAASAGVAGAQANKAKKERNRAQRKLDNWYENEMASNVLDRADTRSMLSEYRNTMNEQNRKYLNNAIKGGASDEAKVAYAQSANSGYANAISKIAAQGQLRRDQVVDSYMRGQIDNANQTASDYMQSGQQMSNAISKAGRGISSAVSGMDLGSVKGAGKSSAGWVDPTTQNDWDYHEN